MPNIMIHPQNFIGHFQNNKDLKLQNQSKYYLTSCPISAY